MWPLVSLHLSLDQMESARIIADKVMASDIKYSGIDMDIAGVYLALVWIQEFQMREGVSHL